MRRIGFFAAILTAVLVFSSASAYAVTTTIDLTSAGATNGPTGTTAAVGGNFIVTQINPQSTGTGVIDSFLRVQSDGSEQGYNTSNGTPYDDKGGNFTRALSLSEIPTVTIGVTVYRQFLLDINQTNSNSLLNLNQIEIFQAGADPACPNPANTCGTTVSGTFPVINLGTPIFQMSADSGLTTTIKMDYSLNPGSGAGDMFLYVPNSDFNGLTNVILYSQFGNPPGANGTNDGFEEWAVLKPTGSPCVGACEINTPEPGSLILLGTGLVALGLSRRKKVQN